MDKREVPQVPADCNPVFSVAGVMPGEANTGWRTAMPDPTRDVLDTYGHVITKAEAKARAELSHRPGILTPKAA